MDDYVVLGGPCQRQPSPKHAGEVLELAMVTHLHRQPPALRLEAQPSELCVHYADAVHFVTGAKYPASAVAHGGVYVWKDGRDTSDTFHALLEYHHGREGARDGPAPELRSRAADDDFGLIGRETRHLALSNPRDHSTSDEGWVSRNAEDDSEESTSQRQPGFVP